MIPDFQISDYGIWIGNLQAPFCHWFAQQSFTRVCIVTDTHVAAACLPVFLEKSGLSPDTTVAIIPAGEHHKTMVTCEQVWSAMMDAQLDRHALCINLGGGVIGDLGGFCAATWKRGIQFIQVPTTLLSMTDAAIGGKLGIDFKGIKNSIGVFKNPMAVFVDPDFLSTLPARECRSGMGEILKHARIGDPILWQNLLQDPEFEAYSNEKWVSLLQSSIAVKVKIVTEDPYEKDLRMLLNYGHTIGHAIESYYLDTPTPLTHGESIAIGMILESKLVNDLYMSEIEAGISRFFPNPPSVTSNIITALWQTMLQDKKNKGNHVRISVPTRNPYEMKVETVTFEAFEKLFDGSI